MFFGIFPAILVYQFFECNIILGLSIGDISQVSIQQIIVVHSDLQHLAHTSIIGSKMTVGSYQESILVHVRGVLNLKLALMLHIVLVRHLYAILDTCATN